MRSKSVKIRRIEEERVHEANWKRHENVRLELGFRTECREKFRNLPENIKGERKIDGTRKRNKGSW